MSVYRTSAWNRPQQRWEPRGSFIVELVVLGIPVRKATGIYEQKLAEDFEECLRKLATHGRRDLIEAFVAGHVSGPELLAGVEGYGVTFQLQVTSTVRLRRRMYEWLRDADLADKTKREYRYHLAAIAGKLPPLNRAPDAAEARALETGPTLRELPALLAKYAKRVGASSFAQGKAACQSMVSDTVPKGRHSDLWRDVSAVQGPKPRKRNVQGGLTPERARAVAERLAQRYSVVEGQVWWQNCCTGMEPKECWRRNGFGVEPGWIAIHGTKRGTRDRLVARIVTPVMPTVSLYTFRKHLKAVGDELGISLLTPYVARRTFAHWLEKAKRFGVEDSQCDILLGHTPKTDREKYREHDIAPYLPAIAAAMRKVIGEDPVYMKVA